MASPTPTPTRTLTARCLCRAVHFTITLPESALPLPVRLCHCNVCRYTHGTLSVFHADLPRNVTPQFVAPSSTAACLTGYRPARTTRAKDGTVGRLAAASERFFCSTCGAHVGDVGVADNEAKGQWVVATSLLEAHGPDVAVVRVHCFTRSAYGGGFEGSLPRMGGREVKVWNPGEGEEGFEESVNEPPPREVGADGEERLRAQCHCGGVSFTIGRPTEEVLEDEFMRAFVSPLDKNKWSACLDLCDDCRLVNGTQ
jgi:hypothetical protein